MKRIILFRFHKNLTVCKNRIQLLKKFNPDIEIFGIFGGEESSFYKIKKRIGRELAHIYCIEGKSGEWKWKNSDLVLRLWYIDYGRNLPFDILHVIEWDMLIFTPISKVYAHIPADGIGLSGLIPLRNIERKWSWTSKEPYKNEWEELLSWAKDEFQYKLDPYACIAGGACFPRRFLEEYSIINIPELSNDELRMPLFSQILGFKLYDTGFYRWFDKDEEKFFNIEIEEIKSNIIKRELSKPSGRRVFHPYRRVFSQSMVDYNRWYNIYISAKNTAKKLLCR